MERLHGDFRQECQCSFAAYQHVGHDIERVVVCNERSQVQACHVLDAVFFLDTFCQLLVSTYLITQSFYFLQKFRMCLAELSLAVLTTRIHNGTVS